MKNSTTNSIGINRDKAAQLSSKLNTLLSNFQIYYQNLRGFHWNITGSSFFELHVKFEELYTTTNEAVDTIAERILTLEGKPLHTFEDYLDNSSIKAAKDFSSAESTVGETIDNLTTLIQLEREIMELAGEIGDEGTNALLSDYIREQEKTVWMLRSFLVRSGS